MNSARTVSSPVAASRSTRAGWQSVRRRRREPSDAVADERFEGGQISGCRWTRSSISPVSRSKDRDLRPRPSMWPEDEIDEDERSVADADIAGTRTTLQPAHHLTSFVSSESCVVFPSDFSECAASTRAGVRAFEVTRIVTIDPNPVIERHSRARRWRGHCWPLVTCAGRVNSVDNPRTSNLRYRVTILVCARAGVRRLRAHQSEWAASSAGRAPRSQCGGREFDPRAVHQPSLTVHAKAARRSLGEGGHLQNSQSSTFDNTARTCSYVVPTSVRPPSRLRRAGPLRRHSMVGAWKPAVVAIAALAASGGLAVGADTIRGSNSRDAGSEVEWRAISALNDCIQRRFEDINDRFGVARIVRIGETPHRFQPESVAEMGSVRALEQARLQVILYVAGTRVLRPTPTLPLVGNAHALAIIKGPVRVTPGAIDQVPPPSPHSCGRRGGARCMSFSLANRTSSRSQVGRSPRGRFAPRVRRAWSVTGIAARI